MSPNLAVWHRYDPAVKADLFSTFLKTASSVYLVDPIPPPPDLLKTGQIGGIIVTNSNHVRATVDLAFRLAVPVFAHPKVKADLQDCDFLEIGDGQEIAPLLVAIAIEGAAPGEIALHYAAQGGSIILGDALINMESHGFAFLPAKYCGNQKLMRRSLRKLLDYSCERLLFAHGTPIVAQARSRLAQLLDGNSETAHA